MTSAPKSVTVTHMGKEKTPEIRESRPVEVNPERIARARRYMDRMAKAANAGDLADNTLLRLQRPSQTVLDLGLPNLVLRQGLDGVWRVAEWDRPESNNHTPVRPEQSNTQSNTHSESNSEADESNAAFDKRAYQREYMRKRRAEHKDTPDNA